MANTDNWVRNEIKTVKIRDERLVKRLEYIITKLSDNPEGSLPQAFENPKDIKGLYRLLSNENIDAKEILKSHSKETAKRIQCLGTILMLQDTTSFNYEKGEYVKGMGIAGEYNNAKGLIMHSTLAVSTEGTPLGILSEDIWTRDPQEKGQKSDRKGKNNSHKFKIEEKESMKWIDALGQSVECIPNGIRSVIVCDREADIYKFFYEILQKQQNFVIRVGSKKRRVSEEMKLLGSEIESKPVRGEVQVQVPKNVKDGYPSRTATLNIKYCPVSVLAPQKKAEFKGMPELKLNVILAEETGAPDGVKPIKWCLLTSLPVDSVDEAFEKVQWYKQRWIIERYHYILKSGCLIEELRLEDIERLKRAISIYSIVAWRIGWLTYEGRNNPEGSCEKMLAKDEWQALYCVANNTKRLPGKPPTIGEAVLMIAKLGGFMSRKSDGDPGLKVIWRGWRKLSSIMIGWNMARLVT